jgi:ankyrin repeat protein
MREVDTLRKREHPNIISLLASFTLYGIESGFEKKSLNMMFEYAEMNMEIWMSLEHTPQHLQSMDQAGRRKYLYNSMYELVSALSFLHRELDGMITAHHDLKPKNILLLGDTLKIGDLGGSQLISPTQGSETDGPKGTFTYHPPEYWNDNGSRACRRHGRSFDMWSMGCILTEMATLVVYGWEQQQVRTYRERRSKAPQQRKLKRQSNEHQEDDSFHNHMNEVCAWIQQLKDTDGSRVLIESLGIAQGMLKSNPKDRLYSWEAELDLFELLHPDNPRVIRLEKGALCVQPPGKGALSGVHTPIHRAKLRGNQDRVNQLLQKGWSASVHHRHLEVSPHTETLQGKGLVNYDTLPLGQGKGDLNMVSQPGDNPQKSYANELSDFANAVKHKSSSETLSILAESSSLQELLREEDDDALTALHWTARFGSYTTMDYLLRHLEDKTMLDAKDSFGKTALHHASEKASTQVMQLLLGAYPQEGREDWILAKDSNGKTPLHWAAQGGNISAARLLLSCVSTPSAVLAVEDDGGNTPLRLAIKHASSEVETLLLNWC